MGTLNRAIGRLGLAIALAFGAGASSLNARKHGMETLSWLRNSYRGIRSAKRSTVARDKRASRKRRNIAKRQAHR